MTRPRATSSAVDELGAVIADIKSRIVRVEQQSHLHNQPVSALGPPGTIVDYIGTSAPSGWEVLDGSTIIGGQFTYPDLWAVLPASFKSGSNIVLPDTRGRVSVGRNPSDTDFDAIGDAGGVKTVTLTAAQSGVPAHSHGMRHAHDRGNHTHTMSGNVAASSGHTHTAGTMRAAVGATGSDANSIAYQAGVAYASTNGAYTLFGNGWTTSTRSWNHWTGVAGTTSGPSATTTASVTSSGSGITGRARNEANTANKDSTDNNTAANASQAHTNVQPYITFSKIMKMV